MHRVYHEKFGHGTVLAMSIMDKSYLVKWDNRPLVPQWIEIRLVTDLGIIDI